MSKSVKLTTPNQETLELPVLEASIGHDVVDIRALTKNTGLFSFDPGFVSTASCESKITYIDGDEGLLYYRGYPIEQLAEKSDYLEVCYLLIYGELPTPEQKKEFDATVSRHTMLHEQLTWFFRGFRRDAHPMAMMVGVVGALSAFYQDSLDIANPEHRKNCNLPLDLQNPDKLRQCVTVIPTVCRSIIQKIIFPMLKTSCT